MSILCIDSLRLSNISLCVLVGRVRIHHALKLLLCRLCNVRRLSVCVASVSTIKMSILNLCRHLPLTANVYNE